MASLNSFKTRKTLSVGNNEYTWFSMPALSEHGFDTSRLPFSMRILLENLLRHEDGEQINAEDIRAVAGWDPANHPTTEIAFTPARVVMQDFTGVPAVVDLAAMRDAMASLGGDPAKINPQLPTELVIDHSVQVDHFGSLEASDLNVRIEFQRNKERYAFLRWGQGAFDNFRVVPPGTGIVHQVNLERLARTVMDREVGGVRYAYPDTLVGTDSHTTMINGLGVLGWGVGGIEAEAAMLGQPIAMLIPQVVGFRLVGALPEGATATDLVLTVVQMLRAKGVVGKFVEFYGPGISALSLADRATIANMAPEYGATCGIFPIDDEALSYLRFSGRSDERVDLVEAYLKAQGMFHTADSPEAVYTDSLELDLATIVPSIAGPKRPQDRIELTNSKSAWAGTVEQLRQGIGRTDGGSISIATKIGDTTIEMRDGLVVIAAITSCTNTSNPSVMVGAGLVAKKAAALGLQSKPWVKTSLAPGSKVVTEYLKKSELLPELEKLGFHLVGYGCTTCIGNSGPLPEPVRGAIDEGNLVVTSVLSGNRNFEGRISPHIRANYLASPPLVVAYALAGRMDIDLYKEPLGTDKDGNDVFLQDIWPSTAEVTEAVRNAVDSKMFTDKYADVFEGSAAWKQLETPEGDRYAWAPESTYVRHPTFFAGMDVDPEPIADIEGARALALLGETITTDHISPAGAIAADSPAGQYLQEHGVAVANFNSFGSRRGNHEVMMRGTFGNVRLRNQLAPGTEGGWTRHQPSGDQMTIFDASGRYAGEGTPLIVLAGGLYGTGSSRDWAAKGTILLGVRAVIAKSFERIHRSNLLGMGVLPLQFADGQGAPELGLDGTESFKITGIADGLEAGGTVYVSAVHSSGKSTQFDAKVRIDTPLELEYYRHGGILQYVIRRLLKEG